MCWALIAVRVKVGFAVLPTYSPACWPGERHPFAVTQVSVRVPLVNLVACVASQGDINLLKLARALQPSVVVPLANAEIDQSGPLSSFIIERGSVDDAKVRVGQCHIWCRACCVVQSLRSQKVTVSAV